MQFRSRTDWRWRRAIEVLERRPVNLQRATAEDDDVTAKAAFFKRDYDRGLGGRHQAHDAATDIYFNHQQLRIGLEGCLLCGQEDDEICAVMGMTPDLVAAYHDLFFDVRPRLMNHGWISAVVFGGLAHADVTGTTRDIALRIAWIGGWEMFYPLVRNGMYTADELDSAKKLMLDIGVRRASAMMFTAGNHHGSMEFINGLSSVQRLSNDDGDVDNPAFEQGRKALEQFEQVVGQRDSRRLSVVADISDADNLQQPAREKRAAEYEVAEHEAI